MPGVESQILEYEFGTYVGEFDTETQRRHGVGIQTYKSSGNSYEGEWKQGVAHGKGKKKYGNGDFYDGFWVEGKRSSEDNNSNVCSYVYSKGHEYIGEYKNDQCNGFGKLKLAHDAGSYEGEWKDGQKSGKGIERGRKTEGGTAGGGGCIEIRYEGEFQKGTRHGKGFLIVSSSPSTSTSATSASILLPPNSSATSSTSTKNAEKGKDQQQEEEKRFETEWLEGAQISGPKLEEELRLQHEQEAKKKKLAAATSSGPIADATTMEALAKAGVAPEALQALGAFSTGVERSFGALNTGVAGMENHINGLMGSLEAMLGSMEDEDGEEGEDEIDDMEYESEKKKK